MTRVKTIHYSIPILRTDSQGRELGVLVSYNNSEEPFRRDSLESFGYRYVGFDASTGKISDAGSPAQLTAPVDGDCLRLYAQGPTPEYSA